MKATPEQFNQLAGEHETPLNYPAFLDSYRYQLEREAKRPRQTVKQPGQNSGGMVLFLEWLGILVIFLIAGWVQ